MANAKSLPNKNKALNTIPITKAQAAALKIAKVQAQALAKKQLQEQSLAESVELNSDTKLFQSAVKNARPLNI